MRSALFLLLGFLLGITIAAPRAQVSLSVFGKSWHSMGASCQTNPGLGVSYTFAKDWRAVAGYYKNSMCERTTLAGVVNCPVHFGNFCAGFGLMRLTGYSYRPVYVPLPVVSYEIQGYAIDAVIAATDGGVVVGLGLRLPL